ncbi:hypothetical protein [Phenylobacterium sp.]|uniref:hypothetical protein n=1 Tax=Phenylobacterium sp. TaxID=1871053 RepID=UPI002CA4F696|nr:hypothetical protein [Phenylobacterium sp.]HLZ77156.1 hypothetical protein [Phenylobacterium sp.]
MGNALTSHSDIVQRREAYIEAVLNLEPRVFVTLVLGLEMRPETALERCKEFLKRVERVGHGSRWAKWPPHERLRAYGFVEHLASNLHWHIPIAGPDDLLVAALNQGRAIWGKMRPSGQFDAQIIRDPEAVAKYVTKALCSVQSFDLVLVY